MQDDMSIQRVIVGAVEAIEKIGPAELAFIGTADPVPAKSAATTAIHVGKFRRKAEGMGPAAMCHESGHQHGILTEIIDEKPILSGGETHVYEECQIPVVRLPGIGEKGPEQAGLFGKSVCFGPFNEVWIESIGSTVFPLIKADVVIMCCYHAYDKSQSRQHEK
jgi:hypothetical protein